MTSRLRTAAAGVPHPLRALLAVTLLLGVVWALVIPPFQAPDEQSHFGYVQSLVAGPGLPGKLDRPAFSTEQYGAHAASNSDQTAANLGAKPTWSSSGWEAWQQTDDALSASDRSDGGGAGNPASPNPPLYYVYDAVPYAVFSGGDFFTRVTAMRLASVLWLLVTVAASWLLAGEVFGRDRLLQLVTASVAGLVPMVMFVSAQIGPDTMMYALWSVALWLGVRILKRGVTPATAIGLLGVTGLAIVVKATSYALVPAALFALAVGAWRIRHETTRTVKLCAAALAALAVPVIAWIAIARIAGQPAAAQLSDASGTGGGRNFGQMASYLWQFYLPRLPSMSTFDFGRGGIPANQVFVKQFWGAFGWLEVRFPAGLYRWLLVLTVAIAVAAVARLVATWRQTSAAVAIFLLLAVVALLAGLHWTDYTHLTTGRGSFMQSRYLFPLIAIAGLALAQAISWTRGRGRAALAGVALGGLFALQLASLALVATRFYA